jgi:hypothetical protein
MVFKHVFKMFFFSLGYFAESIWAFGPFLPNVFSAPWPKLYCVHGLISLTILPWLSSYRRWFSSSSDEPVHVISGGSLRHPMTAQAILLMLEDSSEEEDLRLQPGTARHGTA